MGLIRAIRGHRFAGSILRPFHRRSVRTIMPP